MTEVDLRVRHAYSLAGILVPKPMPLQVRFKLAKALLLSMTTKQLAALAKINGLSENKRGQVDKTPQKIPQM